ncbi:Translation initiation factor [Dirofilaria immitis]
MTELFTLYLPILAWSTSVECRICLIYVITMTAIGRISTVLEGLTRNIQMYSQRLTSSAPKSGHKAEDARRIAERAVTIAEERAIGKHEVLVQNYVEKQEKNILKEIEQTEKENTFYNIALQLARAEAVLNVFFQCVVKQDGVVIDAQ